LIAPSTIAIDGPAASGKSSLGDLLAAWLGCNYLDTGVMYRAVAWAAVSRGVAVEDEPGVTELAEVLRIEILEPTTDDGRHYTVLVDGQDVTWDLRQKAVELAVSPVSEYRGVRHAMTVQQRRIAERGRIVMVGRDIGTVVLPKAELKIYLDASLDVRARRRHLEMLERDPATTYQAALDSVLQRDLKDSQRSEAPLMPAADAIVIDSTNLSIRQVLGMVLAIIENGPWNIPDGG
jgi:cytidylate kinase